MQNAQWSARALDRPMTSKGTTRAAAISSRRTLAGVPGDFAVNMEPTCLSGAWVGDAQWCKVMADWGKCKAHARALAC